MTDMQNCYKIIKKSGCNDTEIYLKNLSDTEISLKEVCVAAFSNDYSGACRIYGEGFTMLSQYTGVMEKPECMTKYDDFKHYRLYKNSGQNAVYNCLIIENDKNIDIYAFSSCRRFSGRIEWDSEQIKMILDLENIRVAAGETIRLENILVLTNADHGTGLDMLSDCLKRNHAVQPPADNVTGWCSWLCFGPYVTAKDIDANMHAISVNIPQLKYVQIDDGYQKHMGDWLDVSDDFGDIHAVIENIRRYGAEPAIWAAPFIADKDSRLLAEHPDYFVQDSDGNPLASDKYTFGGWRCAPWYILDGSNPQACAYLEHVFSTMRREWGIKYYKLDANCWGSFSFGIRHDRSCTSVEAYRMGMAAVRRGAGEDAVLLGCNAPMWPSIGEVNAMRVSGDMCRRWRDVKMLGRETCARVWTSKLWCVDPDVITLKNQSVPQLMPDGSVVKRQKDGLNEQETEYHKCAVFAAAGSVLAGDDLSVYGDKEFDTLKIFLEQKHSPARFNPLDLSVGHMSANGCEYAVLFNPDDTECEKQLCYKGKFKAFDVFSDRFLGEYENCMQLLIPPHGGKLVKLITEN